MNILVHLLIAHAVQKRVWEQTGVKLRLSGFLYGNVLPDLSASYDGIPHFFKASLPFVLQNAALLKSPQDSRPLGSFSYAKEAGVVTHYLSDYFCYVHSENGACGMGRHHFYEFSMLLLFTKGLTLYKQQQPLPPVGFSELEPYLNKRLQAHACTGWMRAADICSALAVSTAVSVCLLQEAMVCEGRRIFADALFADTPSASGVLRLYGETAAGGWQS